mgnify:CR=1 FL=1
MIDLNELNRYRDCAWELEAVGVIGDSKGGCFKIPYERLRRPFEASQLRVMASSGGGWDHISVSLADRCPTWDELEYVRRLFAKSSETWMQLHVPEREHVNFHPHCLHLWRPLHKEIPKPPSNMVGPK